MNFHEEVLPEGSQAVLPLLKSLPSLGGFYLAGGTALVLRLGHRMSGDFDFFTPERFNEESLIGSVAALGKFQLEQRADQTIAGILNGVKLSFLGYDYPVLFPFEDFRGIRLASTIDIACMKLAAIAGRGAKRDFIDIYFIAKEIIALPDMLGYFGKKYSAVNYNMMHIKKSLVYFDDADLEPMPRMIKSVDWEEVKTFFREFVLAPDAGK